MTKPRIGCEFTADLSPGFLYDESYSALGKVSAFLRSRDMTMSRRAHIDDDMIEVPTRICKNVFELRKSWKHFDAAVKKLKLSYHTDQHDSGGGHIHLEVPKFSKKVQKLFLLNLYTESANNPWTIWAFNSHVDNCNALNPHNVWKSFSEKDLLAKIREEGFGSTQKRRLFYRQLLSMMKDRGRNTHVENTSSTSWNSSIGRFEYVKSTRKVYDYSLFEICQIDPFFCFVKKFAIIHRSSLRTVEFRFLDTPSSLHQLNVNYDVCIKMYNKCLKKAINGEQIKSTMTLERMKNLSYNEARTSFIAHMRELKMTRNVVVQHKNLRNRFNIQKMWPSENLKQYLV